jgi:hypothetical protein
MSITAELRHTHYRAPLPLHSGGRVDREIGLTYPNGECILGKVVHSHCRESEGCSVTLFVVIKVPHDLFVNLRQMHIATIADPTAGPEIPTVVLAAKEASAYCPRSSPTLATALLH